MSPPSSFFEEKIRGLLSSEENYTLPNNFFQLAKDDFQSKSWPAPFPSLALGAQILTVIFYVASSVFILILCGLWVIEIGVKGCGVRWKGSFFGHHITAILEGERDWAISFIYTPHTTWQCHGGKMSYILPSKTRVFKGRRDVLTNRGREIVAPIRQERDHVKILRQHAINLRRQEHEAAVNTLPKLPIVPPSDALDKILKNSAARDEQIHALTILYDSLSKDIRRIEEIAATQATQEQAGYEGLAHWAKDVKSAHENLMQATITIAFVGASITYTTIFSANRGNIGLMSWSFGLFNIGFILPVISQALLNWATRVHRNIPFNAALQWRVILSCVTYISLICVTIAIFLLNITILHLHYIVDPTTGLRKDSGLELTVQPKPSSIMMFVFAAASVAGVLGFMLFYILANGFRAMKDSLAGPIKSGVLEAVTLDSYVLN